MSERSLVSVLVLNYQGEQHLEDCLASLTRQSYDPLEIVVADNGSSDRSQAVARRFDVRWEPLESNHGFALGNNLGVDRCKGDVVVFVNNDMRFDERFIEEIVAPLRERSEPPIFAVDAQQLSWVGDAVEHGATRLVRAPWRDVVRRRSSLPGLDLIQDWNSGQTSVIAACGSAMAVRKEMFETLGGFDARFPAGWEDVEICWRAALRGWSSLYSPLAVACHKVGGSSATGEGAEVRLRGSLVGRLLFVTKHLPFEYAIVGWLVALSGLAATLAMGRLDEARVRLDAIFCLAAKVPFILRERQVLYKSLATTSRRALRSRLA